MLILIEGIPIHLAIATRLPWLAWLVSAGNGYALCWLLGDHQALRHERSRLVADRLELRVGARWRADIPLAVTLAMGAPRIASRIAIAPDERAGFIAALGAAGVPLDPPPAATTATGN